VFESYIAHSHFALSRNVPFYVEFCGFAAWMRCYVRLCWRWTESHFASFVTDGSPVLVIYEAPKFYIDYRDYPGGRAPLNAFRLIKVQAGK